MSCRRTRSASVTVVARVACVAGALGLLLAEAAAAEPVMQPTAPEKMMAPDQKERLAECQEEAARRNIAMDERAAFLMRCLKGDAQ